MNKYKSAALAVGVIIISLIFAKILINAGKSETTYEITPKPKKQKIVVKNVPYVKEIHTSGRMFSFDRFDIYAEVTGVILKSNKPLRAGTYYKKGEPIIKIDDSIFNNQLIAKRSSLLNQLTLLLPDLKYDFPDQYDKWVKYLDEFNVQKDLPDLPEFSSQREKYYLASKNVIQSFYDIKAMEATHAKYVISAPYNGYLTSSFLREGDLARTGQKLGTFIGAGLFEMQAAVQTSDIKYLKKGMDVILREYKSKKEFEGKIVRINPAVSVESQSVTVYIQSKNKSIRDGLYYDAILRIKTGLIAAKIPKEAFDEDMKLTVGDENTKQKILPEIIDKSPRYYYVKGLKDGEIIYYNKI